MKKIEEIIYTPTLRCNYNCAHCGQDRSCEEKSCSFVLEKMESCEVIRNAIVKITGGDPFLKDGIVDLICKLLDWKNLNLTVHITTNGSFPEKIKELVKKISYKDRISFSISIDGLEKNHNQIRGNSFAYQKAVQSTKIICEAGIYVSINTVVQPANLDTILEAKKELYKRLGNEVPVSYIPLVAGISKERDFSFSDEEIAQIYPLLSSENDKKYVISGEAIKIEHCHAGQKNITIAPDGKLYSCLTGFSYLGKEKRAQYCMGDLAHSNLSELLKESEEDNTEWQVGVSTCAGCTNPCELMREVQWFELQTELAPQEVEKLKTLIRQEKIELSGNYLALSGWHPLERYEGGQLQWMSGTKAKILHKITAQTVNQIAITYGHYCNNNALPLAVSVIIDNEKYVERLVAESNMQFKALFSQPHQQGDILEIEFVVNTMWSPYNQQQENDHRQLGIFISSIKTC